MRPEGPHPVAILVGDFHLRHTVPPARAEKSWYPVMERQLKQIESIVVKYGIPVIYPGDIFDRWDSPPELINFAAEHLPYGYAVPGQHDLPYHRVDDVTKSAYWTLVLAHKIRSLCPNDNYIRIGGPDNVRFYGFPWGERPEPLKNKSGGIHVAVVHEYVYDSKRNAHPGAAEHALADNFAHDVKGYDCVVIGDNHRRWSKRVGRTVLWNGGSFFRIKSDERGHKPAVGILYSDGHVKNELIDVSEDVWADPNYVPSENEDVRRVVEELAALGDHALNFAEAVRHALDRVGAGPRVRELVMKHLGGEQ